MERTLYVEPNWAFNCASPNDVSDVATFVMRSCPTHYSSSYAAVVVAKARFSSAIWPA